MRVQLTDRDYEQLSAYIDGQLTPAEKQKLEERLRAHSDLQAGLDEMGRTRMLLRSAPRRRAPRNFTLTPAMVGDKKPGPKGSWWNLFPVLSFSSAVATLALVASIVFQLLPAQKTAQTVAMESQSDRIADIVQRTMTAMQATAPVGAAAPLESEQTMNATEAKVAPPEVEKQVVLATEQPAAAAQPATAGQPEATGQTPPDAAETAQPAMEASAILAQSATESATQNGLPVIAWGGNTNPIEAGGIGGGGQPSTAESLLGPPATTGTGTIMGKGGGGGEQVVPGQNIVIPQESVNPEEATGLSQPEVSPDEQPAPAQANPAITGTGPILGVPSQGEGGEIVDRKAILGQPAERQQDNGESKPPSQPGAETDLSGEPASAPGPQILFGLPVMLMSQVLLALIAIATGIAAFIVRRRAR